MVGVGGGGGEGPPRRHQLRCIALPQVIMEESTSAPVPKPPDESQVLLVTSLVEVLWNIVVQVEFREMLASHKLFFPLMLRILPQPQYAQTHVTCFHLLAILHQHSKVPADILPQFRTHFRARLEQTTTRPEHGERPRELYGMSLRDIIDFCAPLLWSGKNECIAFGAWYFQMYYYHCSTNTLASG